MEIRASNESTLRFLNGLSARLDAKTEALVEEASLMAADSIRLMLSRNGQHARGSRSGHAPVGETPRMETGTLHGSVQSYPARKTGFGRYSAEAMPTAVYAEAVDQGTRNMGARPYMDRARSDAALKLDSFLSRVAFELVR
jgi:hypothetical protein